MEDFRCGKNKRFDIINNDEKDNARLLNQKSKTIINI